MNKVKEYTEKMFEEIKHIDERGNEYWEARELQHALSYKEWRKFNNVINKAIAACNNSNVNANDQFVQVDKLIQHGKGGNRNINSITNIIRRAIMAVSDDKLTEKQVKKLKGILHGGKKGSCCKGAKQLSDDDLDKVTGGVNTDQFYCVNDNGECGVPRGGICECEDRRLGKCCIEGYNCPDHDVSDCWTDTTGWHE